MQAKKSKSNYLNFQHASEYLFDPRFSREKCHLLLSLRARTFSGAKVNYRGKYKEDLFCDLCRLFPSTQEHYLRCIEAIQYIRQMDSSFQIECESDWVYGTLGQQLKVTSTYQKIIEVNDQLLSQRRSHGTNREETSTEVPKNSLL